MNERSNYADAALDDLLRFLRAGEDAEAVREEVLRRTTPIIGQVIGSTFEHSGFATDELFRPGYLGLLNAVYNFDLSKGKPFREYAENLIKGEIRQHIRDAVKQTVVPQWMKDLNRQIESAEARLLRETGRLPTLGELADAVNITEEGITEIFKAREALGYVSLDAQQRQNDPVPKINVGRIRSLRETPFPIENRIRIASALERLADLQRSLLHHLFGGET